MIIEIERAWYLPNSPNKEIKSNHLEGSSI